MTHARYLIGDVFEQLATLEPNSVDLVLTSPPFLALRSYLPADHPDKAKEIGSEATPAMFIDRLLDVVEALDRVLAPHGSICIELGDTYSGNNESGWERGEREGRAPGAAYRPNGMAKVTRQIASGWPLDKSLCLIPETFRFALVYGYNPHNGRRTPRWRARNVIRWVRPNPPVGALGDKFRPATSELVVLCKSRDRYFDLDAVRTPYDGVPPVGGSASRQPRKADGEEQTTNSQGLQRAAIGPVSNPAGAPPLDWWNIPTQPYSGSHYATFPEQLCITPIKAMSPLRVCRQCGQPSRRIVAQAEDYAATRLDIVARDDPGRDKGLGYDKRGTTDRPASSYTTVGWSDCGCSCPEHDGDDSAPSLCWSGCPHKWRPGVVLDPFAGSGTTLQVATGHGRNAIGIDLDESNAALALDRVGPLLLTIEQDNDDAAHLA